MSATFVREFPAGGPLADLRIDRAIKAGWRQPIQDFQLGAARRVTLLQWAGRGLPPDPDTFARLNIIDKAGVSHDVRYRPFFPRALACRTIAAEDLPLEAPILATWFDFAQAAA